jgi:DNA helicase IV
MTRQVSWLPRIGSRLHHKFSNHFSDARVIKLDVNYRSTKTIVDASTEIIRKNKFQVD